MSFPRYLRAWGVIRIVQGTLLGLLTILLGVPGSRHSKSLQLSTISSCSLQAGQDSVRVPGTTNEIGDAISAQMSTWSQTVRALSNRYGVRIIAFAPEYQFHHEGLLEIAEKYPEPLGVVERTASAACLKRANGLWIIAPSFARAKSRKELEATLGMYANPLVDFVKALPSELAATAVAQPGIPVSALPREILKSFAQTDISFIPTDVISESPSPDVRMHFTPKMGVSIDYREYRIAGLELLWHSRYNQKRSKYYAKQLKGRSFAEVDAKFSNKEARPPIAQVLPLHKSITFNQSTVSVSEVMQTIEAACGVTITADVRIADDPIIISPSTYSLDEFMPAFANVMQTEWRVIGDLVHVGDATEAYAQKAVHVEADRREMERYRDIQHVFRNEEIENASCPFAVPDFLAFRTIRYLSLTPEQKKFIDWLLAWVEETPTPEQLQIVRIRLSPGIDIGWTGSCSGCGGGTGVWGTLYTYPEPL